MKIKILIVMINLVSGGAEKSLINLLNEIDYSKYDIDLLLFQKKGLFLNQLPFSVNVIDCPLDIYFLYNKPTIKDLLSLKKLKMILYRYYYNLIVKIKYGNYSIPARRQIRWNKYFKSKIQKFYNEYDIALSYLNNDSMLYVIDKVVAKKRYLWVHNNYQKNERIIELDEKYYKNADKIITISPNCLKIFNQTFPMVKSKSICIPNISSEKIIKSLANEELKFQYNNNVFKIISIGRLSYEKGFDIAVEAAKILKDKKINYQWFVVGDGPMKRKIEKTIKEYNLEKYFNLIGITDNPYTYINQADILVQPSRTEGKSMVLDEAKILCKPFVVTKYPTVYDQANENIAIIVDINANAIANGILELYNNKHKINEMKNNLKKINNNDNEIQKYYDLLDSDI